MINSVPHNGRRRAVSRHGDRHKKQAEAGKKNKAFHTLSFSSC
jgi:hypothetical protein